MLISIKYKLSHRDYYEELHNRRIVLGDIGDMHVVCVSTFDNGAYSYYAKNIGGEYWLHRDDGPIVEPNLKIEGFCYAYFNEGIQCNIEDLPCDGQTKMLLKLKYG